MIWNRKSLEEPSQELEWDPQPLDLEAPEIQGRSEFFLQSHLPYAPLFVYRREFRLFVSRCVA